MATRLMNALVRLNQGFAALAPAAGGLRTEHFMDVFRQFAVHWDLGDLPPSGAQDPESTDAPADWRAPCFPSTMKGRVATEEDRCDSEPVALLLGVVVVAVCLVDLGLTATASGARTSTTLLRSPSSRPPCGSS
jgi:hypothetical protein